MTVERARALYEMLSDLQTQLTALPIRDLEISARGTTNVVFTISGYVPDESTRRRVAAAFVATGLAIDNHIVFEGSRRSGLAPSSFDGALGASPARVAVRALLDRAAPLSLRMEDTEAVALCREAEQLAVDEPALLALALYAHGCYLRMAHALKHLLDEPVRPLFERARDALGSYDADPILYERISAALASNAD